MLLAQLRQGQTKVERFWSIWRDEYLATLRERGDNQLRQRRVRDRSQPVLGDVVIIKDEHLPRAAWSLGRMREVHHSADEEICSVSVTTPNRILKRPLCLVYPTECSMANGDATSTNEADTTSQIEADATSQIEADATAKSGEGVAQPATAAGTATGSRSRRLARSSALASCATLQQHIQDGSV